MKLKVGGYQVRESTELQNYHNNARCQMLLKFTFILFLKSYNHYASTIKIGGEHIVTIEGELPAKHIVSIQQLM